MRDFVITTDSNADLPDKIIEQYGTIIIPTYYTFDDTVYGDELKMPPAEFYERMKNGEKPTSQASNPAVIEEKFCSILDQGKDIIHISFSSALSGSYNNACMVADQITDEDGYEDAKITIIDSLAATLGEGIMLIMANRKKEEGLEYDEVVAYLESFKMRVNHYFTVDDLFHLHRGGRISKTTAVVGSTLKLKPFMFITDEGTLASEGTFHGRKKALSGIVDKMLEVLPEDVDASVPVGIVHGNCIADAEAVANIVKERTPFKEIIISDINPSIGTHSGPGTIAVLFHGATRPKAKAE